MSVHSRKVAKATVTYDTRDGGIAALVIKDSAIFPEGFKHTFRRDSKQSDQIRDVFLGQPRNNEEWEKLSNDAYCSYLNSADNVPTKFFLGADRQGRPVILDLTESQVSKGDFLDAYLGNDPSGAVSRFLKLQALTRRNPLTIVDINYCLDTAKYIRDGEVMYEASLGLHDGAHHNRTDSMCSTTNPKSTRNLLNLLREEDRPTLVFVKMQMADANGAPIGGSQNTTTAKAIDLIRTFGRGKDHIDNVRVLTDFDLRCATTSSIINVEKEHGKRVHTVDMADDTTMMRLPSELITNPPMMESLLPSGL